MVSNTIQCGFESHPGHLTEFGEIVRPCGQHSGMHLYEHPLFDVPVPPQRRSCFRCSPQPLAPPDGAAYGYLLGLYVGDGCVSSLKRGVYSLRIFCAEQYPGLIEACREAMQAVRPDNRIGGVSKDGCVAVTSLSKHWPCLLPQHGPGMKHTRPIELLPWQQDIVESHNQMFLRGLSIPMAIAAKTGSDGHCVTEIAGIVMLATSSATGQSTFCASAVKLSTGKASNGATTVRTRSRWLGATVSR